MSPCRHRPNGRSDPARAGAYVPARLTSRDGTGETSGTGVQIQTGAVRTFLRLARGFFLRERRAKWLAAGLVALTLLQVLIQIRFNL